MSHEGDSSHIQKVATQSSVLAARCAYNHVPQKLRQVGVSLVCLVAEIPFSFFVSALVAEIVAHQPCLSSDC